MDKLEKVLTDIKIADLEPDENLVRLTKLECKKTMRLDVEAKLTNNTRRSKLTVRLLAAATFVAFIFVALIVSSIRSQNPIQGAAYYTIDINPSFGFTVDEENIVIDVSFQNKDAEELYEGMDCVGLKLQEAIKMIIIKAEAEGYMDGNGSTYVLLGQFLLNETKNGENTLDQLIALLQNEFGDGIRLIGVNGDKEDIELAKDLEVSPGILILCEMVDDVEADEDVKVEDVVKNFPDQFIEPEFSAPVIKGEVDGNTLVISWEEIDFSKIDAEGLEVEYKLLKGASLDEIKEMKNVVSEFVVDIADDQPTSFELEITERELDTKTYYCLYIHCSKTSKLSNVLPVTTQSADPTEEPEITPEPIGEEGASEISGSIAGGYITLNWTKIDSERFDGYKVMYSSADSTPVYGEEGCYYIEFVTDANKLTGKYKLTDLKGYEPEKKYYFSITVLYDGQEIKIPGNVISKIMPKAAATATPAPTNNNAYPSTTISGARDGDKIYLSWNKISDERLDGYKVVYSFTDSTPAYSSSPYLRWITSASTTAAVINLSELGDSTETRTCYFSITALYDGQSVKIPGNAISIEIPPVSVPEYVSTTVNYASYSEATGKVSMSWNPIDHPSFEGYKVVYSFTDPEPVYGDGCSYVYWITNAAETACSFSPTSLTGYEPGKTGYFSVSVLYDSHSIIKGTAAKSITFPGSLEEKTAPSLTSAFCSESNGVMYLTWSGVEHSLFEGAYKACFSFTNTSPSYGASGTQAFYITGTSFSIAASELTGYEPGATVYMAVTALYSDDDNQTSNVKSDVVKEPTPTPTLNSATCSDTTGYYDLRWNAIDHELLTKYVIVYTINGTTGEILVDKANTSHGGAAQNLNGFESGASCTFYIEALYSNGDVKSSNTISCILYPPPA